jgi:hypothetical protein
MRAVRLVSIVAVVLLAVLLTASRARVDPLRAEPPDGDSAGITAATSPLLQYQGRLADPGSGEPVADGSYSMTFRLYTVASGGTALWTETKDVAVQGGLFSTSLGDTVALSQSLFNGQELWLGIKVGSDDEATPRQQILPAAYALGLVPGAAMQADSSSAALQVTNLGSGDALLVNGQMTLSGNLTVSGALSGGTHTHSGADITSGTVAEAYIDEALARDSEILPTVLDNDGAGSTLDADLLDGQDASAFAATGHDHDGSQITSGVVGEPYIDDALARDSEILPTVLDNDGAGSMLDADLLDGQDASAFAATGHDHDGSQITSGVVGEPYIDDALARDAEVQTSITGHAADPAAHHPRYTDDEAWAAVLARDDEPGTTLNADLLDGQDASAFAATGHDHDGSQITSGVVGEPYIDDALARDLEVEQQITTHQSNASAHHPRYTDDEAWGAVLDRDGPSSGLNADLLDGYSSTNFAFSSHNHFGNYWSGSSTNYGLSVYNSSTGDGIRGSSSATNELYGGLYGYCSSTGSGVVGSSSSGHGVHGTGATGVYGTGITGVYGTSSDNGGQGVQGHGTGTLTEGVLGTSAQATGVYGIAGAESGSNAIGVWGQTGATWGFFTYEAAYAGQGFVSGVQAYIAQSEDSQPLEVGDVVLISGITAPLAGGQTPVLTVRRAGTGEDGLLGVVQTRAVVDTAQALMPSGDNLEREEIEIANKATGRVAAGDYLFVVLQGLVQVRVDASTGAIAVGDAIGPATTSGAARKVEPGTATAPVVGHALEPLPEGTGLVWVLVLGR